jgi:formate-dependent nitrite reductase membrane component NrfD
MTSHHDYQRSWESRGAARSVSDLSRNDYYGIPVVKAPHWNWLIALYFFLGGISSACHVVACIAALLGGRSNRQIERAGRYLALVTLMPSPLLLILDLGRPERFYRMLRVVKLRSPMSVGTWGLSIFGGFCTLSALTQAQRDGLFRWSRPAHMFLRKVPDKPLNIIGSFFGFFVGGYTGVLLSITAIPVWAKNYLLLGPLFLCSALSTGTASITLVLSLLRGDTHRAVRKLELIDGFAKLGELSLLALVQVNLGPVLGRPFRQGRLRHMLRWGVLGCGIMMPISLKLWSLRSTRSRLVTILSSVCSLVGGYCLRHLMVYAGHESAADPQATFAFVGSVINKDYR